MWKPQVWKPKNSRAFSRIARCENKVWIAQGQQSNQGIICVSFSEDLTALRPCAVKYPRSAIHLYGLVSL